ncbi:hypothetical protein [Arsenophonus endosymbiont of Aleurodicus dispersus]|uniref:hypothetical protein n=1 Tax=Arsenophonus endosymbiont of Aleurodicus dispersus TaxID=235559 RepID=UPI000EB1696D|nr:hypothetical protein [Arsenophonus endosymbiont of Aleurodicus dispersus]
MSIRFGHLDPDPYHGDSILGLHGIVINGMVIKSYGAANLKAFKAAIEQTIQKVEKQIPDRISTSLNTLLPKSD